MKVHDIAFTGIDGKPLPLAAWRGKAILVVNTASECGYTPQYTGLQALWRKYRDRGLVVLGVPSNDFGGQEPGSEAAIKTFCEKNYGVDFPLTAKVATGGAGAHAFYRRIAEEVGEAAPPKWNFHKYLFGADGELVDSYSSSVAPESARLTKDIEAALPWVAAPGSD
jgi:glutathione peroxidase